MLLKIILLFLIASSLIVSGCGTEPDASAETAAAPVANVSERVSVRSAAETISGRLSGFDCAVVGELCPTTHRGGDYTTGVYTEDGAFYFVVNIPPSFLTQHFLEVVEIEGRIYEPYAHAIEPEAIHLLDDGERRLIYEAGYFIDAEGRRATFHDGRFEDGRWVVP